MISAGIRGWSRLTFEKLLFTLRRLMSLSYEMFQGRLSSFIKLILDRCSMQRSSRTSIGGRQKRTRVAGMEMGAPSVLGWEKLKHQKVKFVSYCPRILKESIFRALCSMTMRYGAYGYWAFRKLARSISYSLESLNHCHRVVGRSR